MDFEGEVHIGLVEGVEDGQPALGEILEAFFIILLRGRREGIDRVPDRGTGEAVDHGGEFVLAVAVGLGIEKRAGGLGGEDHFFGGAFADTFGIAIAPDIGGRIALWRSSMRSQMAWPTRWLEMA